MTSQKIANAADWDSTTVHTLPSGRAVELVADPPNVFGLAAKFGFTDETVAQLASGVIPMSAFVEIAPAVCQAMFVQPNVRVRDETGEVPDGCLPFDRLSNDDVGYILEVFTVGIEEVAADADSFRSNGNGSGSGDGGKDVPRPAKRAGGTARRKPARSAN